MERDVCSLCKDKEGEMERMWRMKNISGFKII